MGGTMPKRSNPIDAYLEGKEKTAAERDTQIHQSYQTWQANPNKKTLGTLLDHFNPMFNQRVGQWKAPNVPEAAFRAELKKHAITAIENYDPSRGASLNTHVGNIVRRAQRFNAMYQNMAFIPEEKSALIAPIQQAHDYLHQEKGQAPDNKEIATYLSQNEHLLPKRVRGRMTPQLVQTVRDYQIKDIPDSSFASDPTAKSVSYERETIELLRPALKGDEVHVYDYLTGTNGKPLVTSTGEIAKRMGKSPSQISRLRGRIDATYKKYT